SRRPLFERLRARLADQCRGRPEGEVEILHERDRGEAPLGRKRNLLIERSTGEFIVFVDDDDDVHERYVELILAALDAEPDLDSLGIRGEVTFRGRRSEPFVMSNRYRDYRWNGDFYERPPHHINPVRRDIARRYPFEEVDRHED